MDKFIKLFKNKKIHVVGVTGAEGSNIVRFLLKHHIKNITVHDLLIEKTVEKSFKVWHKGLTAKERENAFTQFTQDLSKVVFYHKEKYLKDIFSADIIFVPQSWRLYERENRLLFEALRKKIPFWSLTKLYLDLSPATVIAVTGTVGKGSVAYLLSQVLKSAGKNVYFAGNETWRQQVADQLDLMSKNDFLIIEVSHRQLLNGINKGPQMAIFTNLYPNHLDEITWTKYKKIKYSLFLAQSKNNFSILNHDFSSLIKLGNILKSKVVYFSANYKNKNIKSVQMIFDYFKSKKTPQYFENILAVSTCATLLGVPILKVKESILSAQKLPARLEKIAEICGIEFYDDIKSTTPWATVKAVNSLEKDVILIMGGKTKGLRYQSFIKSIESKVKFIYLLQSELSELISKMLPSDKFSITNRLDLAVLDAYNKAKFKDKIVLSPAASHFYSLFIKGKTSFRKIVTSLPPKEQFPKA